MNDDSIHTFGQEWKSEENPSVPVDEIEIPRAAHPEGVPEKFWDPENGAVRVEALVKSYQELERKLGAADVPSFPEGPDGYAVKIDGHPFETDAEVDARLHSAGLTNDQVQTVYELANEKLMPLFNGISSTYEADNQLERLKIHFGGEIKWDEARRQIASWGRERFSDDVFNAISSTYEGVMAMKEMMSSNEPGLGKVDANGQAQDENALRAMMSDPRYWRERDPAFIEQVRQGFRDLYPEN